MSLLNKETLMNIKSLMICLALSGLVGCASTANKQASVVGVCNAPVSQENGVKLDMVRQLIDGEQYYSALAHLENDNSNSPHALWLRAEAQRKTGLLDEAYESYRDLSLTCMTAYGHAGMAKILATRGNVPQAHQQMLTARKLAPTDADIRNDYGFILLVHREFKAAQREFMTALQLAPGHPVATRNMVMSLILDGDTRTAARMAKNNGIPVEEFRELIGKANHFKQPAFANSSSIKQGAPL